MSTDIQTEPSAETEPLVATLEQLDEYPTVYVSAGVQVRGESSGSHCSLDPDSTPDQVANALLRCAFAAAQLHGPNTYAALQARLVA